MNYDTSVAQSTTWARPSEEQFEAYFRQRLNFVSGMRVAGIIYAVGPFHEHDDWDLGRVVYEWRRQRLRVRVYADSDYVVSIESLDPTRTGRFDQAIEVLWRHPCDHGRTE